MNYFTLKIRQFVIKTIRFYQRTVSPDHGFLGKLFYPFGACRYHPTCSEYTIQAIEKYGVVRGSIMGTWRVLRCNPWSKGGEDPLR